MYRYEIYKFDQEIDYGVFQFVSTGEDSNDALSNLYDPEIFHKPVNGIMMSKTGKGNYQARREDKHMEGYHFLTSDYTTFYGKMKIEIGVPLEVKGRLIPCQIGLHACKTISGSLPYIRGPILCRVLLEGDVIEIPPQIVGRRRTVLWWVDMTPAFEECATLLGYHPLTKENAWKHVQSHYVFNNDADENFWQNWVRKLRNG